MAAAPGLGSVSRHIAAARAGAGTAVYGLWEHFGCRLERASYLALKRAMVGAEREEAEDAALSAFHSFHRGLSEGRFAGLTNREDAWRLLRTISGRKARHRVRDARRLKRGGGWGRVAIDLDRLNSPASPGEQAAEMLDLVDGLHRLLGDDTLRLIVLWRIEGYGDAEIAERLGCTRVTIQRKLRCIRARLTTATPPALPPTGSR